MEMLMKRYKNDTLFSGGSIISQTRGANPQDGGANLLFYPIFPKSFMKMEAFGPEGVSLAPP